VQATLDLARLRAAARDPRATALAGEAAADLGSAPLSPPLLAATVHGDLGRAWLDIAEWQSPAVRRETLAQVTALFDDSARMWTAATVPAALEPRRAAALAALTSDRARAARLARP
jgi:hypothetical protein